MTTSNKNTEPHEKPTKSQNPGTSVPAVRQTDSSQRTSVLIIGPCGAGKTALINTARGQSKKTVSVDLSAKKNECHTIKLEINSKPFTLIDSPGLDSASISDCDIFVKIMQHLGPHPSNSDSHWKINGIIYIHPDHADLGSGTLWRNLRTLKKLIGEKYLERVTILLRTNSKHPPDCDAVSRILCRHNSAFNQLSGVYFGALNFDQQAIQQVLLEYISLEPESFSAQTGIADGQIKDIRAFVEEALGQTENAMVAMRMEKAKTLHQQELQKIQGYLALCQKDRERLEKSLTETSAKTEKLREQLKKNQQEYGSLRSHLQVQEHVTLGQIKQNLDDLNRDIEEVGRTISEYLLDTFPAASTTSLDAVQLPELKKMFEHVEGKASLVISSTGTGMSAADFFDYAVRTILCRQLSQHIFDRFHPSMNEPNPVVDFIRESYRCIQLQESQSVAGGWRSNTFKSISQRNDCAESGQLQTELVNKIVSEYINPLLTCFYGISSRVKLQQQHIDILGELVSTSWNWNEWLKGTVVVLGDFQPVMYQHGDPFDPQCMSEFESSPGNNGPDYILSTIGLGVTHLVANGGGKGPQRRILCKAIVASQKLFE